MRIYTRRLLAASGFLENQIVTIRDGWITGIEPGMAHDADVSASILTPGLIDLHVHGGEGFNARDFELDAISPFLDRMLACGVTGFLMTISTGSRSLMRHGLEVTRQAMKLQTEGKLGGSRVLGAHLEGPFLSSARAGAMQVSAIHPPSVACFENFFGDYSDIVRLVSLAPEEAGADALIRHLLDQGIQVQAGHTDADFAAAQRSFAGGVASLCHTFNASRGIHHREPGVVAAALLDPGVYCEAICDLEHLHPGTLELIYRMKGAQRMMLISDSVATHGLPDGEYFMEGYHILVRDGISRTYSGSLDGGGAYLDQAVRNIQSLGIPMEDALRMASTTPAERMHFDALGIIAAGKRAHLTAWNEDWSVAFTVLEDGIHH